METTIKMGDQLRKIAEKSLEDAKYSLKCQAKDIADKIFESAMVAAEAGKYEIKFFLECSNDGFSRTLFGHTIGSIDDGGEKLEFSPLWGYLKFEIEVEKMSIWHNPGDEILVMWDNE